MDRANPVYLTEQPYELVIFDVRIPGVGQRFSRERAAWRECADVEMLNLNHPVLIVRSGGSGSPDTSSAIRGGGHSE